MRSSREMIWIALATVVGGALRAWALPRLGLDHFDEGIYALGGYWIASPRGLGALDPGLIPYAPPVYPLLVGIAYLALGINDTAPILVSIAFGAATVPLVGWLGRRTFGCGAGAATAWLAALSGPHVAFSRTALTDTTALFTFLLALGASVRFIERPGVFRAVGLGLAVGVAQNTKYNGFLTGVIAGLAWLLGLIHRENRGQGALLRALGYGLLAALFAMACYWPWYAFVEANGGYADLVRHYRGYFDGPSRWLSNAGMQRAQWIALSGTLGFGVSWQPLAWGAALAAFATAVRSGRSFVSVVGLGLLVAYAADAPWWLCLSVLPWIFRDTRPGPRLFGCAFFLMSLLVPLYHPYARLALPVVALTWLLSGFVISAALGPLPSVSRSMYETRRARHVLVAIALGALGAALFRASARPTAVPCPGILDGRDGVRLAARSIASKWTELAPAQRRRLRVYARPPFLWYFGRSAIPTVREPALASVLARATAGDVAVLDGVLARQDASAETLENRLQENWRVRGTSRGTVSLVTRLDADPGHAFLNPVDRASRIEDTKLDSFGRVYLLMPKAHAPL